MADHEDDGASTHSDQGGATHSGHGDNKNMFMYQAPVSPPQEFSFRSEDWERWRNRWSRYLSCSGLTSQPDAVKIDTLIYTMGEQAEDLLLSFSLPQDNQEYGTVLQAFDRHFGVRLNVVLERQKFKRRRQSPDESVDNLLSDLHRLAENCNFGALKEEFIRDQLLAGINDTKLADTLTLDPELTLSKAANKIRQKEELRRQQREAGAGHSRQSSSEIQAVTRAGGSQRQNNSRGSSGGRASNNNNNRPSGKPADEECGNCGKTPQHALSECPARGKTCSNWVVPRKVSILPFTKTEN